MKAPWIVWVLLAIAAANAMAQEEPPDEDFLAFLGGPEADEDWKDFFDSVPDDVPEQASLRDVGRKEREDRNGLD